MSTSTRTDARDDLQSETATRGIPSAPPPSQGSAVHGIAVPAVLLHMPQTVIRLPPAFSLRRKILSSQDAPSERSKITK